MANADPFIRNIYARQDFRLLTAYEQVDMKTAEDRLVRFGSEADYKSLLELGLFVECINNLPSAPIMNPTTSDVDTVVQPVQPVQLGQSGQPTQSVQTAPVLVRAEQDVETRHKTKTITQQDDNINCPNCNNPMILSVDTVDPKDIHDVMYCPGCTYTYKTGNVPADHIQAPPEVTPAPQVGTVKSAVPNMPHIPNPPAKQARTMSRCECGKVKAAEAPVCKNCTAASAGDGE